MKRETKYYDVLFGSNHITKCTRVIEVLGKQFIRFLLGSDYKILFTCKVQDKEGKTLIKVANSKVQHCEPDYKPEISDNGITVTNEKTGEVWLEFIQLDDRKFKLNGMFFVQGRRIKATDDCLEINGLQIKNSTFDSCAAAIGIG